MLHYISQKGVIVGVTSFLFQIGRTYVRNIYTLLNGDWCFTHFSKGGIKMASDISYSLPEAAKVFRIGYFSLYEYVKKGELNAFDVGKGSRPVYRVYENDMEEFLKRFDRTKRRHRIVKPIEKPESVPEATIKPNVISDLTRRQLESKNEEIVRIKRELQSISAKLMDLLIEIDELAQ